MTKLEQERHQAQSAGARWRDAANQQPSDETLRKRAEWRESPEGRAWLADHEAKLKALGL